MNQPPLHHFGHRFMSRRNPRAFAVALFLQLVDRIAQLENKPPVTMCLLALNVCIFFLPQITTILPPPLGTLAKSIQRFTMVRTACLHPTAVLSGERRRLLSAAFIHLSELHLAYNSTSLLHKGLQLEPVLGSLSFLALVLYLATAGHMLYVFVAVVLNWFGRSSWIRGCVAGFSGVLFGLKAVLHCDRRFRNQGTRVFGTYVPSRWVPWAELILASAAQPNVSFLGHLCGILAGLLYVRLPRLIARLAHRA